MEIKNHLKIKRFNLKFEIKVAKEYLERRIVFFKRVHNFIKIISVFLVTGTAASYINSSPIYAKIAGTVSVFILILDVIFQPGKILIKYEYLLNEMGKLERKLIKTYKGNENSLNKLILDLAAISEKIPPCLTVLSSICYNNVIFQEGLPKKHLIKLRWYHKIFPNLFDFLPSRLGNR